VSSSSRPFPSGLEPLTFALWTGLLAGFAEAILLGIQKIGFHRVVFLGADALWMPAIADACFFAIPGGVLGLIAWHRGAPLPRPLTFGVFTFLFLQSCLFMYTPLHKGAAMLLALGVAVQASRILGSRLDGIHRLARKTLPWLAVTPLLLGAGLHGWETIIERRRLGALAPSQGMPNILLIILDTTRALNLGLYGYERDTSPGIDRFARGGVTFDRVFATAPWTLPSHASMFTGRLPTEFNADWNLPLDAQWPTLAEALASRGYATTGFIGNTIYATREMGLDRGFMHYEDHPVSMAQVVKSASLGRAIMGPQLRGLLHYYTPLAHKSAATINEQFTRWLDANPGRPFFAFLNYFDTHSPYLPPAPFAGRFGPIEPRTNVPVEPQTDWTPEQVELQRNAYDASLAYLDSELDSLFAELGRRGTLANTLVILSADHGEEMHEHGVMEHGNSLYRPAVQVPLIVVWPGHVPAGLRVASAVSIRDIPRTVLELSGAGPSDFPGRSLSRFWGADTSGSDGDTLVAVLSPTRGLPLSYPAATERLASIVLGRWRYIRSAAGAEQLFDAEQDRFERTDLSATPEGQQALPGLRAALDRATDGWIAR
jgi:arylsulfatase A-like enzyme